MSLVSIIIPYFHKKNFINNSINSILNQTYQNFEIILVNDEESLETKKFLENISKEDLRIKLINNDKNLGAGESRNKAINYTKGEYIAFCDSDDLWKPKKLEIQLNFMKEFNLDFTFTAYEIINENGDVIGSRKAEKIIEYKNLINSCDIGLSTVIINNKIFNDKKLRFASLKTKEDFVLWLKIAKNRIKLFGINQKLGCWRKSSNSLSSSNIQKIRDGYRVYREYLNFGMFKSVIYLIILSINFLLKK